MPRLTRRSLRARMRKGLRLLERGLLVKEVAEQLSVTPDTVKRWRRETGTSNLRPKPRRPARRGPSAAGKASGEKTGGAPRSARSIRQMLREEAPQIARVLLDMAKARDVRAAALVMKVIGNGAANGENGEEGDREADRRELERELQSLPAAIGAEIVGLLAKAEAERKGRAGRSGAAVDGGVRGSLRLRWQANGDTSDEGRDSV